MPGKKMHSSSVDVKSFSEVELRRAYDDLIIGRTYVEYKGYYDLSYGRFAATMRRICQLGLPPGASHLDIGGGQFAVLTHRLLGFQAFAGDVVSDAQADLAANGVALTHVDLFFDEYGAGGPFDLITLCEVIEHIPRPPYTVLAQLKRHLKPGGVILLTTPNGYRFRNLLYMIFNREILGVYRYPNGHEGLGHQHEYTRWQMDWQLREAGYDPLFVEYYQPSFVGFSARATAAHLLSAPLTLVPHLRAGLILAGRA